MNKGLSDTLKAAGARPRAGSRKVAFSNTNPIPRPIVQFSGIPDPH
jgi:hypothetical protein